MATGYIFTTLVRRKPFDVDARLMWFVATQDIPKATLALANGADPNFQSGGDPPLHIAVKNRNTTLVKLLIVFGANLELLNRNGSKPLELAEGECKQIIEKVVNLRARMSRNTEQPPGVVYRPPISPNDTDVFLLSMDGGGIRGLVFIQTVIELDKRREELYPGSKPFLSYFNWIAGNSTGGIAALALATGRDPINGRQMYFKLKDKVLRGRPPFPSDRVAEVLQDTFGCETTMSEIKDYNIAVMTTLADTKPPKLHIMRNYGGPEHGQVGPDKRRIWEAAQATSAAVPYFYPFGDFIDGGFIANNPTIDAIVDIQKHFPQKQMKAVISLGCGFVPPERFVIDAPRLGRLIDGPRTGLLGNADLFEKAMFGMSSFRMITDVLELCICQTTQPSGEVVERGRVISEKFGAKYFRVNPKITDIDFIETDDEKLVNMMYETIIYMLENHELMDEVLKAVIEK